MHIMHIQSGNAHVVCLQCRRGVRGWRAIPPMILPFISFFFCLSAQSRTVMVIIPLPHYDNFSTNVFRSEKKCVEVPPPPPPPPAERLFRAGAVLIEAFCHSPPPPPPRKHLVPPLLQWLLFELAKPCFDRYRSYPMNIKGSYRRSRSWL